MIWRQRLQWFRAIKRTEQIQDLDLIDFKNAIITNVVRQWFLVFFIN